jgi:hypothetical protein
VIELIDVKQLSDEEIMAALKEPQRKPNRQALLVEASLRGLLS